MNNLNEALAQIAEFLKSETKTETVIGQQFKLGEFTCVPVISVGFGFGGGEGEGKGSMAKKGEGEGKGSGAGAGMGIGPVGFLVTKGDSIQFLSAKTASGLGAAFEKLPNLLEKYFESKKETAKV